MRVFFMKEQHPKTGMAIIFMDEQRQMKSALITAVHGEAAYDETGKLLYMPTVNIVTVSSDVTKRDVYGTQIERYSSVSHRSTNAYHESKHGHPVGMTWQFENEVY